jgi:type III restriction enzyme
VDILKSSGRLGEFAINPQRFMDEVVKCIQHELHRLMISGIVYEKLSVGETEWSMQRFQDDDLKEYFEDCIKVQKSVYETVAYDSDIELKFAQKLDERDDIKLFVKLPAWFKVETPIGTYNPDWAIVKHEDETLYLVRETKSTKERDKLRPSEKDKIACGEAHFKALEVDFKVVTDVLEV